MSENWILADYETALSQLESALSVPADSDLIKAGCIQYFEFSFELAWKSIKLASLSQGLPECASPKACLKQAFSLGWISDEETWLEMLEARNRMSHTYNAKHALAVYDRLSHFLPEQKLLLMRLQEQQ
ncbi:MAG: nucleotidyltransferase substrate binding protein [Burkholderiales bacterium]|nr:nucleotidyltransferase substrate binding protein [Burkholderiales bacterium]